MKTIIAGSRNITDYDIVAKAVATAPWSISELVSGGARGVDTLAQQLCKNSGGKISIFYPDWDKKGKRAGYERNVEMAEYADALIAIWDGKSKGTEHMINIAKDKGLRVVVHTYNE